MTTHESISKPPMSAWQQLKQRTLSVETIRQVDRIAVERFHIPSLVLMEHAAGNCVDWIRENWEKLLRGERLPATSPRVVILCGPGNNGGDGLVIARQLSLIGWHCHVFLLGPVDRLSSDTATNLQSLYAQSPIHIQASDIVVIDRAAAAPTLSIVAAAIERSDIVIDAMLGSGAQGQPRSPLTDWILLANQANAVRLAIDIPTGLNASTGDSAPVTFRADATLTFVARKPGFNQDQSREFVGQIEVLPIGIPDELIQELIK